MVQVIQGGVTVGALSVVRQGYVDNINNANLATIADISTLTATEIAYLDKAISALNDLGYGDYHYYADMPIDAIYTPPAKSQAVAVADDDFGEGSDFQLQFYDGAGWIIGKGTAGLQYPNIAQDDAQSIQIQNKTASATKISFTGRVWS